MLELASRQKIAIVDAACKKGSLCPNKQDGRDKVQILARSVETIHSRYIPQSRDESWNEKQQSSEQ